MFPTTSHANPTLMIVALALRVADHLARTADQAGRSRLDCAPQQRLEPVHLGAESVKLADPG